LQAQDLGLGDKVRFLGYQNDALSYIRSSDVLVLTSRIEGLPGVLLEAMACGVPVVASAVGGIPEIVIDGETGILIRDWSVESYVEGIIAILSDESYRSAMVANAQELVSRAFRLGGVAERFHNVYLKLLSNSNTK
jgi:glycosyltransferase involved in cell wall biosynthesis